jgi:hypothetical protein
MAGILYSIWEIHLNSRELDLAAEEAIVGITSGRGRFWSGVETERILAEDCHLRMVTRQCLAGAE